MLSHELQKKMITEEIHTITEEIFVHDWSVTVFFLKHLILAAFEEQISDLLDL